MNAKQNNALNFYLKCRNIAEVSKKLGISEATLFRYKKTYNWDALAKDYDQTIKDKSSTIPKTQEGYRERIFGYILTMEAQMNLKINASVSEINCLRRLIELDLNILSDTPPLNEGLFALAKSLNKVVNNKKGDE